MVYTVYTFNEFDLRIDARSKTHIELVAVLHV